MAHPTIPRIPVICEDCNQAAPQCLIDKAFTLHDPDVSADHFLFTAHCCPCGQARCGCGGWATAADLAAILDALGDAADPPQAHDWLAAAYAYEAVHAEHRAGHPPVVCQP